MHKISWFFDQMYEKKKLLFAFILGLFLAVKIVWVLLPTLSMGIPRLGDDSLVYLWSAKTSFDHNQVDHQGVKDIIEIRKSYDAITKETDFLRARVTMRTAGISSSPLYIAMGSVFKSDLSLKAVFAIMEIIISLILGFGITYFLFGLVGYSGTSFALGLLIFSIFPNQGIHYLIPSVCTLGLSLILLRVIFCEGFYFYKLFLGTLILLIHPIGQVYLSFAIILILFQQLFKNKFTKDGFISISLLITCTILFILIHRSIGGIQPPTSGMGGINLTKVLINFIGLLNLFKVFLTTQPLLVFFASLGSLIILSDLKKNINLSLMWCGFLFLLLGSLLVDLPGYPAELPSRILVPFVILCLGISGKWIFEKIKSNNSRILFVVASVILITFTQMPFFIQYFFANLNGRYQVLNEDILEKDLKKIPLDSKILWFDPDIQMMTGFLKGAVAYHTIPYSMVANTKKLHDVIKDSKNIFYILPFPQSMNGLSSIQSKSLESRYYGYGFNNYESISVLSDNEKLGSVYIKLSNALSEDLLIFSGDSKDKCTLVNIEGHNNEGWFRVDGCNDSIVIKIKSINKKAKLVGLSFNFPVSGLNWPWGKHGFKLVATPKNNSIESVAVRFDWEWLLGKMAFENLQPYLKKVKIIKDEGGFIWAH